MKLIFCLDEKKGMMFGGKRQSQDSVLRQWIMNKTKGSKLWMSSYSAKQFKDQTGFVVDDNYDSKAALKDYCFVEDKEFSIEKADEVILCHWNRKYQADKAFDIDLKACGFRKTESEDIKGSSHEKISIEIFRRDQDEKKS